MRNAQKLVTVSCRLPVEVSDEIKRRLAAEQGSLSQWLRNLIADALETEGDREGER